MKLIMLFFVIGGGYTLSGLIGFGANAISMPILSFFFDVKQLVIIFAVVSFTNAVYRFFENRKGIIWDELIRILIYTLPGTFLGMWCLNTLPESWMKIVLGCFVVILASNNLLSEFRGKKNKNTEEKFSSIETESRLKKFLYKVMLFAAGVMQGAFVCGGPLYLIYCNHYYGNSRIHFRGMQFTVILFNSTLVFFSYLVRGAYTEKMIVEGMVGLAGLLAAIILSGYLMKKLTDNRLQKLMQIVLIIAGCSLIVQSI